MLITVITALALQAPAGCLDSETHRQFDFWAGAWNVYGRGGGYAGSNLIEIGAAGCVLSETWTNSQGGTGHSLNFVEPETGAWRQIWIGPNHRIDYDGGLDQAGRMALTGQITYWSAAGAQSFEFRGAWTPLESGHVIQHFQQYDPESQTWTDWGLLTYVPRGDDPNGPEPAPGATGPVIEAAPAVFD